MLQDLENVAGFGKCYRIWLRLDVMVNVTGYG